MECLRLKPSELCAWPGAGASHKDAAQGFSQELPRTTLLTDQSFVWPAVYGLRLQTPCFAACSSAGLALTFPAERLSNVTWSERDAVVRIVVGFK